MGTCPGNGGRFPVQATWPWLSCRDICVRFWPVEEEDWMSLTPGTCTTEELRVQNTDRASFVGRILNAQTVPQIQK